MNDPEYTFEFHKHGILVRGALPISNLGIVVSMGEKKGFNLVDAGISQALGATFAIVSKASGEAWRAEIDTAARKAINPVDAWLLGTDWGLSSQSLRRAILGKKGPIYTPFDSDDFGRCHRMLIATGLRDRLSDAARVPAWALYVAAWPTLETAFMAGDFDGVSMRLRAIRGEVET